MSKKVLVVDLDGTLYNCNTFHEFLKYLLKFYSKEFKIFRLKVLITLITLRFFRIISHAKLKYQVLKLTKRDEKIDLNRFVFSLSKEKNDIAEISDSFFNIKILATAAPSCYADIIAQKEGFEVCIGTDFPEDGFTSDFENIGIQKKEAVFSYLKSINLKGVDVFFTDHIDDAPLIKSAKKSIVINPSYNFRIWLKENLINFEVRKTV